MLILDRDARTVGIAIFVEESATISP